MALDDGPADAVLLRGAEHAHQPPQLLPVDPESGRGPALMSNGSMVTTWTSGAGRNAYAVPACGPFGWSRNRGRPAGVRVK